MIELLVAMAITAIIVGVLVSITGIAIDTWNRSRQELRTARQAKAMLDLMANDFESMVTRPGGTAEWLSSTAALPDQRSSNSADVIFFSAATDRYDGSVGTSSDKGGDVSCVGYQVQWKDPIDADSTGEENKTLVLKRYLVSPDETFAQLLGQNTSEKLKDLFLGKYQSKLDAENSFVCENIFQFTMTFNVVVNKNISTDPTKPNYQTFNVPLTLGQEANGFMMKEFRLRGDGIITDVGSVIIDGSTITTDDIQSGTLTSVGISLTVATDTGIIQLRKDPSLMTASEKFNSWRDKNTYHYSKLIQLPRM